MVTPGGRSRSMVTVAMAVPDGRREGGWRPPDGPAGISSGRIARTTGEERPETCGLRTYQRKSLLGSVRFGLKTNRAFDLECLDRVNHSSRAASEECRYR